MCRALQSRAVYVKPATLHINLQFQNFMFIFESFMSHFVDCLLKAVFCWDVE